VVLFGEFFFFFFVFFSRTPAHISDSPPEVFLGFSLDAYPPLAFFLFSVVVNCEPKRLVSLEEFSPSVLRGFFL